MGEKKRERKRERVKKGEKSEDDSESARERMKRKYGINAYSTQSVNRKLMPV